MNRVAVGSANQVPGAVSGKGHPDAAIKWNPVAVF